MGGKEEKGIAMILGLTGSSDNSQEYSIDKISLV